MGELGFVLREDAGLMSDYAAAVQAQLGTHIDTASSFYLLAEALPVRGTLD